MEENNKHTSNKEEAGLRRTEVKRAKEELKQMKEKAMNTIYNECNKFNKPDLIDLHFLKVKESMIMMSRKLEEIKNLYKEATVSCGVGNHNDLGYSKIFIACSEVLKNNSVTYNADVTTGLIRVKLDTITSIDIKKSNYEPVHKQHQE